MLIDERNEFVRGVFHLLTGVAVVRFMFDYALAVSDCVLVNNSILYDGIEEMRGECEGFAHEVLGIGNAFDV